MQLRVEEMTCGRCAKSVAPCPCRKVLDLPIVGRLINIGSQMKDCKNALSDSPYRARLAPGSTPRINR